MDTTYTVASVEVRQLSDPVDADWLEMRGLLWDRADEAENAAHWNASSPSRRGSPRFSPSPPRGGE